MITLDGAPLRCLNCGSTDLAAVGREFDADRDGGYPALEFIRCDCGHGMKLDTLVTTQHVAPKPRPRARRTDPEPSQAAARLDFSGQQALVLRYLLELGETDAGQITERMNTDGHPIQRSVTARRLNDLEQRGAATKTGTHKPGNVLVTTWQPTDKARNTR